MILPYADYGDIFFFINANNKQLQKLQTLQNRALRICLNAAIYIPVEVLHQSAQLPMLRVRRMVHLRNFMFKMKTNIKYLNTRNIRTRLHDAPVWLSVLLYNDLKNFCLMESMNVKLIVDLHGNRSLRCKPLKKWKKNQKQQPFISYKILFFLDSLLCTLNRSCKLMEILDNLRLGD